MEKLSLEEFRRISNRIKEIIGLFLESETEPNITEDELKEMEKEYEELKETLSTHDLSDIPFEEWQGFPMVDDLMLNDTHANIDFSLLKYYEEQGIVNIGIRGCNVRNFDINDERLRYMEESFDDEFIEAHPEHFLDINIDERVRRRFHSKTLTIADVKKYDLRSRVTEEDFWDYDRAIISKIGLELAFQLNDDVLEMFEYDLAYVISFAEGEEITEEAVYRKIAEYQQAFFENRFSSGRTEEREKIYRRVENIPEMRSLLSEYFLDLPEEQSELKERYIKGQLTISDIIENRAAFNGKKYAYRIASDESGIRGNVSESQIEYILDTRPEIARELSQKNPTLLWKMIKEVNLSRSEEDREKAIKRCIQTYLREEKNKTPELKLEQLREMTYGTLTDDEILAAFIPNEGVRADVIKFYSDERNNELLRRYNIDITELNDDRTLRFITYFGLEAIMDFDQRNNNFFSANRFRNARSIEYKFLHYANNVHDSERTILVGDYQNYTLEDFYESFRRMLKYGPTDFTETPYDAGELVGEFVERYPEITLTEEFPIDIRSRFYKKELGDGDIRRLYLKKPELIDILAQKDLDMFPTNWHVTTPEELRKKLEFGCKYGKYYEETFLKISPEILLEIQDEEQQTQYIESEMERLILNGEIQYGPDIPDFLKEKHPELLLAEDAPEELKLAYYQSYISDHPDYQNHSATNYRLTLELLSAHPEYIEYLEGKNISHLQDSTTRKMLERFSAAELQQIFSIDREAVLIATENDEKTNKFIQCYDTKPEMFAIRELREIDHYSDEEIAIITSDAQTEDPNILKAREDFEARKQKYRELIVRSPGYSIYYPEEKDAEFNFDEYRDLIESSRFDLSSDYRRDVAEQIIATMYGLFGYAETKDILRLPDIEEAQIAAIIERTGQEFNRIYETSYEIRGNLRVLNTLFNKLAPSLPGKKDSFKVYKTINEELEQGFTGSLEELLTRAIEANGIEVDRNKIADICQMAETINTAEKMRELGEEPKRQVYELPGTTEDEKRILTEVLEKAIKQSFYKTSKISEEEIRKLLEKEFARTKEDGSSYYSPHTIGHMEELMGIVRNLEEQTRNNPILNNNTVDILREEKGKIGPGWIRKLLRVSDRMSESEIAELEEQLYQTSKTGLKIRADKKVELIDKSEDGVTEAYRLLKELDLPGVFTYNKGEKMFAGLARPLSQEFARFFLANKKEMLQNPEYYTQIQEMHNNFDRIIQDYAISTRVKAGKYTVKELLDEIKNSRFSGIKEGEYDLEYWSRKAGYSQKEFEVAQKLFEQMQTREEQSIPPTEYRGKRYRGRILRIDDPLHLSVGKITTCCQRIGEGQPGESSMIHSATEENGAEFVIEEIDSSGKATRIVAQSWVWRNDGRVCFDNVEIPDTLKTELTEADAYPELFQIYQEMGRRMIEIDREKLQAMVDSGQITQEQYNNLVIREVTIGTGCDDLIRHIPEEERKKYELLKDGVAPKESNKKYSGINIDNGLYRDSRVQLLIAENEADRDKERTDASTEGVDIKYTRIRGTTYRKGREINPDMMTRMKQMNERAGTTESSVIGSLESNSLSEVVYNKGLSSERIEDYTIALSDNDDWYILTSQNDGEIHIEDSLLTQGIRGLESQSGLDAKLSRVEINRELLAIIKQAKENGQNVVIDNESQTQNFALEFLQEQGVIQYENGVISVVDSERLSQTLELFDSKIDTLKRERLVVEEKKTDAVTDVIEGGAKISDYETTLADILGEKEKPEGEKGEK